MHITKRYKHLNDNVYLLIDTLESLIYFISDDNICKQV